MRDRDVWVDPAAERLWTSATIITFIRIVATAVPALWAIHAQEMVWIWVALIIHWVGDSLDGEVARWRNCETRIGSVMDMLCDRFAVAVIYLGMCWIEPMPEEAYDSLPGWDLARATSCFTSLTSRPGRAITYIWVRPMPISGVRSREGSRLDLNSEGFAVSTEVGATSTV